MTFPYALAIPLSAVLHGVLLVSCLFLWEHPDPLQVKLLENEAAVVVEQPVQAQLIDTALIEQAVARQKQQQQAQQRLREETQQAALQAEQAQVQARAEQQKLTQLKQQHRQQQDQLQQAQQKLARAEQKLQQDKQRLIKEQQVFKAQQKKAQQRVAALEAKQLKAKQRAMEREIKGYVAGIVARIEKNRQKLPLLPTHLVANVTFKLQADGTVYAVKLVKKSGYPAYDEQALRAVYKASPFRMPDNPEVLKLFMQRYKDGFTSGLKNEHEALT